MLIWSIELYRAFWVSSPTFNAANDAGLLENVCSHNANVLIATYFFFAKRFGNL